LNKVQSPNCRQFSQLIFANFSYAVTQVVNAGESTSRSLAHNRLSRLLAQTSYVSQSQTNSERSVFLLLERAQPLGTGNIDRQTLQSRGLRIFNNSEGRIKTHRLVIENRRRECSQVIAFQICAGVGNERKARRVRFRKTVKRK